LGFAIATAPAVCAVGLSQGSPSGSRKARKAGLHTGSNMCAGEEEMETPWKVKVMNKSLEAERIRSEIQRAKLDAQMMRLQLQAHGASGESLIPSDMGTGGKLRASDLKWSEHKRLIDWLADNVDLSTKQAYNVPDPEVNVGGHRALLGRMAQWKLNVPGGLRLSAPLEAERELLDILTKTQRDLLGAELLEEFADNWLLVTTDLVADNVATPALFLIHKESHKAIVVSAWPSIAVEPPPVAPPMPVVLFDPAAFFNRAPLPFCSPVSLPNPNPSGLAEVAFIGTDGSVSRLHCAAEGMLWTMNGSETRPVQELGVNFSLTEQFTLTGPFGSIAMADPLPGPM